MKIYHLHLIEEGIKRALEFFVKKVQKYFLKNFSYFFRPLLLFPALLKIKSINRKNLDLKELVNFSSEEIWGLIKPAQIQEEILELLKILEKIKPKTILEIGTAKGGTLFLFSRIASEDAIIISIDLPGGKFGGGYPKWKIPIFQAFKKENQKLYLLREDSHKQETLEKVKKILNGNQLDFLFIDGDHTYEGVKKDFEMYSPLVKREGVIALHDIVHHPFVPDCQVEVFWKEIKQNYKTKEIISSPSQTWAGIGVVFT
ncbi:MAG: O-methyltransferase [Patescibacteria group bacterium]